MILALAALAAPPLLTPDPRGRGNPDRAFDLQALDLDLAVAPPSVSGTATLTVKRLGPGPLVLDQIGLSIDGIDGVPWRIDGERLVIDMGDTTKVAIRYHCTPQSGLHFRGGGAPDTYDEVWSQGEGEENRHWFPSWDHPGDRFAYTGRFTVPEGWTAVTNSGPDLVNYLVMFAAAKYERYAEGDAVVYAPPGTTRAQVDLVLEPVASIRAQLERRTGAPYAWGEYRQVMVQRFLYGGMENTGATIEQQEFLFAGPAMQTRRTRVRSVVAHELAHQWFGDLLTCRTWRETWLNEGFATFFGADWEAEVGSPAHWASRVFGWYRGSLTDTQLAGRFYRPDLGDAGNPYSKGASVLQMLRVMLGEDRFWAGIRAYVADNAHGLVESADLRRAMEDQSGQDLGWFFQQWVELPHVPVVTVTHTIEGTTLRVKARQQVDETHPRYTLPVTVEIGTACGKQRASTWMDDGAADVQLPLTCALRYVAFDPDGGVLAKVTQEQAPSMWEAQAADGTVYARFVAIDALGHTRESKALTAILGNSKEPVELRVAAAQALGEQRATAALLPYVASPDEVVRVAVLDAIGKGTGTEAGTALKAALSASNPDVAAAALRALGKIDPKSALPAARSAIKATGIEKEQLVSAAANILAERGTEADVTALLAVRNNGRAVENAIDAAGRLGERLPGIRPKVARAAEALLEDPDLRWQRSAMGALARVGDDASVAFLELFRRSRTVESIRKQADDTIHTIQGRDTAQPLPNQLAADVAELKRRLDDLQEQLEREGERH